jgi:anti-sigma factor RsiW
MMKMSCKEYTDRIVDYVDGELPEDEAQRTAQHLAACEGCRRTAQALERSLGLAKVLWSDNLSGSRSAAQAAPMQRSRRIRFYAVAATILLAASALLLTVPSHHPPQPSIRFEDVQRQVTRAGMAAQLLAATRIVAQCEGTESIVEQQYRYILREYAGTPAAESIRARYGSRLGGIQ